jgi:hypothetical protein
MAAGFDKFIPPSTIKCAPMSAHAAAPFISVHNPQKLEAWIARQMSDVAL